MGELRDAFHVHCGRLVDAYHGLGEPLCGRRLAGHALDALAAGQALADRLCGSRWVNLRDAFTHGATLGQAATAVA